MENNMIFGRHKLIQWAVNGGVTPFEPDRAMSQRVNECCIDLSLFGIKINGQIMPFKEYSLEPDEVVNFVTTEFLVLPDNAMGTVTVRSLWAQRGLNHLTSQRLKPGWQGYLILELHNVSNQAILLKNGDRVVQIDLAEVSLY
jgi:deoxycytidine triphosphate deaminase